MLWNAQLGFVLVLRYGVKLYVSAFHEIGTNWQENSGRIKIQTDTLKKQNRALVKRRIFPEHGNTVGFIQNAFEIAKTTISY